ncbi:Aerobic-type carbon monoxide dehydrogenase, middle subunit CoxM/CutM-like protein [uncultured Desulfobacterium sp.]|uniref:Aerobic-type carbon monoxide dehydrogenase, middle subunit CoxM/CutM-like protein n=1 Tax=uncultured Desulfobacterium sp. TaxID=201089 RepID=A0A445N0H9_9BACT|nr:Aerobic-type carbon monoxide dehydrogenase, middle subunit CoxM/CutM-like protein [uncultured Desulfobacterium sp.]
MKDMRYIRAASVTEVTDCLKKYGDKAKILAGGQSLVPLLRQRLARPGLLIDISRVADLKFIRKTKNTLKIGALTTHRQLETDPLIREHLPILADMEKQLASVQIRNLGTLGGNLCHADPAGDVAPALMALGAKLKLISATGARTMSVENFFKDFFETAIRPDEVLAEIDIPLLPDLGHAIYIKHSSRGVDTAIIGVGTFILKDHDTDTCKEIRLCVGAVGPVPIRAKNAEAVIRGKVVTGKTIAEAGKKAREEISPVSDLQGSAEYKKELIEVFIQRALKAASSGRRK